MKYLLLIFGFCLFFVASAQNPGRVMDYADRLYERGEYIGAVKFYKTAMELDSANPYLLYQYGSAFRHLNQLQKAAYYLEKVSRVDFANQFPQVDYELGNVFFQLEEYRYAERYYRKALRNYRRDKESIWYQRITQRMKALDFVKSYSQEQEQKKLSGLDLVNTMDSDFSPVFLNDSTLLFASLRADSLGTDDRIKEVDYFSRIYRSSLQDSTWQEAEELSSNVNLSGWDIANPAFDEANEILYFSKCDTAGSCEIWKSKYQSGNFSPATKVEGSVNDPGSNNTQAFPAEINGEEFLFFASDRKGGFGELDIWYAKKAISGKFSQVLNAGPEINSLENEISPFYSKNEKRLYFSSTWHEGFGGFDVFYSEGTLEKFAKPINAGKEINSSYNDYYFRLGNNALLLASDRQMNENSCCCNNLYTAEYNLVPTAEIEKKEMLAEEKVNPLIPTEVSVDVLNEYLPVELYFHNDFPDPGSWDTTTISNYASLIDSYIKKENEYTTAYAENFAGEERKEAKKEIEDFFSAEVKGEFEKLQFFMPMLERELEKGNKIQMTIKGYASSISGSEYNLNLTLRRIESLINYLKSYKNGILQKYIASGSLHFLKLPFGDYVNPGNEKLEGNLKIYSPAAAKNRKIEILAITETADGAKSLSGSSVAENPEISFNSTSYKLKVKAGAKVSPTFIVSNKGNAELKIYAVDINCECATAEFKKTVPAKGEERISVNIDTNNLQGRKEIKLLVISNAVPNIQHLKIELLVE